MRSGWSLGLLALLGVATAVSAEEVVTGEENTVRGEVTVVNLPVTVTDHEGLYFEDLKKADFTVWEDGEQVEVRYFTRSVEEEKEPPLSASFIIDLSNTAGLDYKTNQHSIGDLAWMLVPEGGKNKGFRFGYHTEVDEFVDLTSDPNRSHREGGEPQARLWQRDG